MGDIHQPLHAINRYSAYHPRGDQGGNSYLIRSKVADNLHAYWDRGLGKFTPLQRRQVTTGVRIWQYAEEIEERYPVGQTPDRLPIEWANESRAIAESYVYQIPEGASPTKDYHDKGIIIMEERLALAGYRLAAMLNSIYTK